MRALSARAEIQRRLRLLFPPGTFDAVASNPLAAAATATMMYIGAVIPDADPAADTQTWARPSMCLWLSDAAYVRVTDEERVAWLAAARRGRRHVAALLAGWGETFEPWYADNSRETLRDETFRRWLDLGAIRRREGIRTTSSAPRWALVESFAALFDPALSDGPLDAAIDAWTRDHLTPGDRLRVRTARERARDRFAVDVTLPGGRVRALEPGEASLIIKGVVEQWAPARLSDPVVLTISEPGRKLVVSDSDTLLAAGLTIDVSLLLCDVLLVDLATAPVTFWMVEAVASDGPIDEDRKRQFLRWAASQGISASACRFLTAFASRNSASARRRLKDLAAGTYAWYVDEPDLELAWYEITR